MPKIGLRFINRRGQQLVWANEVKSSAIGDLRDLPERVPAGLLAPGEPLLDYVMKWLALLVGDGQHEVANGLTSQSQVGLAQYLTWYAVWQRDDKELQRRGPHESFYVTFKREPNDDQYVDCYVDWGEVPVPKGATPVKLLPPLEAFINWFARPQRGHAQVTRDAERLRSELKAGTIGASRVLAKITGGLSHGNAKYDHRDEHWSLRNAKYDEQQKTWLCRRRGPGYIDEWATLHADGTWQIVDSTEAVARWERLKDWDNERSPTAQPVSHMLPGEVIDEGHPLASMLHIKGNVAFMAFATTLDDKTVFTGAGIGRYDETSDQGPDSTERGLRMSEVAQGAWRAVQAHYTGEIRLVEFKHPGRTALQKRALDHLRAAKDGDGLFFLCANDEIIDDLLITKLFGLTDEPYQRGAAPTQTESPHCGKIDFHVPLDGTVKYPPQLPPSAVTVGFPERKPPKFAILAEMVLHALADPGILSFLPSEVEKAMLLSGAIPEWNAKTRRKYFGRSFAVTRERLHQAQKMVFDNDFSQLVIEAAEANPNQLVELLQTARPPFDPCWVEWNHPTSPLSEIDGRWGMLLSRRGDLDDEEQYEIIVALHDRQDSQPTLFPGALLMSFRERCTDAAKFIRPGAAGYTPIEMLMGKKYCAQWGVGGPPVKDDGWRKEDGRQIIYGLHPTDESKWIWDKRYRNSAMDLMQHGQYVIGPGVAGEIFHKFVREVGKATGLSVDSYEKAVAANPRNPFLDRNVHHYLSSIPTWANMIFREVIAGLALVATHVGGSAPLLKEDRAKTGRNWFRGKFHPAVEYKILRLARPVTAPDLFRQFRRRARADRLRWHQVMGHWAHQRMANALCRLHPRVCQNAQWRASDGSVRPFDDDRERKLGDIQACTRCNRHRWWVRDHARGDVREGMLEKGYEITASRPPKKPPKEDEGALV